MVIEIEGAGRWLAGELNWPAGGFPTSVWFLRTRRGATDQLIAPWFHDAHLDEQRLPTSWGMARQRIWLSEGANGMVHLTQVTGKAPGGMTDGPSVLVRGVGADGVDAIVPLPRDVPLGLLTDEEMLAMVASARSD